MKNNIVIVSNMYSVELLESNPNYLFIFGDNTKRYGKGGQAVIRDCSNSIGLATKNNPSNNDLDFFSDNQLKKNVEIIRADIEEIKRVFKNGNYDFIAFPEGGLGTGLSDLPNKAPQTYKKLLNILYEEFKLAGTNYKN